MFREVNLTLGTGSNQKSVSSGLDQIRFFYNYFQTEDGQNLWGQMESGVIYRHSLVVPILVNLQSQGFWPAQLTGLDAREVRQHSTVYVLKPLLSGLYVLVSVLDGPWMIIPQERKVGYEKLSHLTWVADNIGRLFTEGRRPEYDIFTPELDEGSYVRIGYEDEYNLQNRVYLGVSVEGIISKLPPKRDITASLTEAASTMAFTKDTPRGGSLMNN